MKIKSAIQCILVIVLLASCSSKNNDCEVRDILSPTTDQQMKLFKLTGYDWMKNAMVCRMGEFEIATPATKDKRGSNIIFVFKKGKPVFYRSNRWTDIYSPKLADASFGKIMAEMWHGGDKDDVKRLWYQTVGKDPEVMLDDTNFDGQPDFKTIWKNHKIIKMYEWENDRWERKEGKNIPNTAFNPDAD